MLIEWEILSHRQGWTHNEDNQVKYYSVILKRKSLWNTQNNYHSVSAEWYNIPRVNQQIFRQIEPMCKSSPWWECTKLSLTTTFCFRTLRAKICGSRAEIGEWCVVLHINLDVPAQALAPYAHLQWNHWAKDMPGRTELNPWSFGVFFSGGKSLFDCSYKPAVYGCILPVLNMQEQERRKRDSGVNHLKKTPHLSPLISRQHCREMKSALENSDLLTMHTKWDVS